jgi:hypothetical protein
MQCQIKVASAATEKHYITCPLALMKYQDA